MRALILSVLILAGCAAQEPLVVVAKVPEPPVIVVPERPVLPDGSSVQDVVRGVRLYILDLEAALAEAIEALKVYRAPATN